MRRTKNGSKPAAKAFTLGLELEGLQIRAAAYDQVNRRFLKRRYTEVCDRNHPPDTLCRQLVNAAHEVCKWAGITLDDVTVIGFGTPGPTDRAGGFGPAGSPHFKHPYWEGYPVVEELCTRLGRPVEHLGIGQAAAWYAYRELVGDGAGHDPSQLLVSAIYGLGLSGGIVTGTGEVLDGAAGWAGQFGHICIPLTGLISPGWPLPACGCGQLGDAESICSMAGLAFNLLPPNLQHSPSHELHGISGDMERAQRIMPLAAKGDEFAAHLLQIQAAALARVFVMLGRILNPGTFVIGGYIAEAAGPVREKFRKDVFGCMLERTQTGDARLPQEQLDTTQVVLMPDPSGAVCKGLALWASTLPASTL